MQSERQAAGRLDAERQDRASRAAEILADHSGRLHRRTDRMFAVLLMVQWLVTIGLALVVTPYTWIGAQAAVHVHVPAAVLLGGLFASLPVALVITRPGRASTRYVVGVAQVLFSALLIHVTGGRIETHFHVFVSLAMLAFYRDWRVFVPATLVVAADHALRGMYWPESVYGILTVSPWRWVEHAMWVVFEVGFLVDSCRRGVAEMTEIAARRAQLEFSQEARFRELYDDAPAAYLTLAPDGTITGANRRATELLAGVPQLRGHPFEALLVDADAAATVFAGEEPEHVFEAQVHLPGRSELWVKIRTAQVRSQTGGLLEYRALIEDVTERREAERQLSAANAQLRESSRRAGMAEVASNVLHNIGNVLTSAKTSLSVLATASRQTRAGGVRRVADLLAAHQAELAEFMASDRGQALPRFLAELAKTIEREHEEAEVELARLRSSLAHIQEVIHAQQSAAGSVGVFEDLRLDELVEQAVRLASLDRLEIARDLAAPSPVPLDRGKVLQIVVNLLRNAEQATHGQSSPPRLEIHTRQDPRGVTLEVVDNGQGIAADDLVRVFAHGFTTKPTGNGFGLHSAALAAQEMGGSLNAKSDGPGCGATFVLELPAAQRARAA